MIHLVLRIPRITQVIQNLHYKFLSRERLRRHRFKQQITNVQTLSRVFLELDSLKRLNRVTSERDKNLNITLPPRVLGDIHRRYRERKYIRGRHDGRPRNVVSRAGDRRANSKNYLR